ncbi:thiamine-repressible mitochondrial transporter THI74 [Histoplasma capsulatum var. duboisii H88]|uniref:Thiamine-repressible mitochondrial transporter THI74 n=1 Tax=Ajellomyces capsulatus (strain H88) TaxID=544711 RepID=A0A8A1LSA4_AJEC8|nr:thiamine-repressible mitochondrial transporter THI74 [Histoplasma capsulatum var. duboisii H88]
MSSEQLVDGSDDELLQQHKPHQHHLHEHRAPVEDMQVEDEASGSVIRSARPQSRSTSRPRSLTSERKQGGMEARLPLGIGRRTLGIILLLIVVVLWTVSNFLASTIFSDNTYSKPFFLTYVNTTFFIFPLLFILGLRLFRMWRAGQLSKATTFRTLLEQLDSHEVAHEYSPFPASDDDVHEPGDSERGDSERGDRYRRLRAEEADDDDTGLVDGDDKVNALSERLGFKATAKLSLEFCLVWFMANYFAAACLQFTTVGSTTILTSTSGVWTLILGAVLGVEKFTIRKLLGVLASLTGIILISRVDLSGENNDENRGSFPHKSAGEIAIGDAMAAFSAILYGVYTIVMKKQVGDESRVNMPLFFGLVGFINTFLLWPCMIVLHLTGWESFELPPTRRILLIVIVNSLTSLVSDILWAYAMLLTTPLVVTVGLSLTIPLSLVAQIVIQGQYSSALYWLGAAIVFFSFLVVNHEGKGE